MTESGIVWIMRVARERDRNLGIPEEPEKRGCGIDFSDRLSESAARDFDGQIGGCRDRGEGFI